MTYFLNPTKHSCLITFWRNRDHLLCFICSGKSVTYFSDGFSFKVATIGEVTLISEHYTNSVPGEKVPQMFVNQKTNGKDPRAGFTRNRVLVFEFSEKV